MAKPKIGIFDFTGCEGCELMIINCEDELLKIVGAVDIVNFREAIDLRGDEYDVALIDGGISTDRDIRRLKTIRERASLLVTIGTCSSLGGINCLKNRFEPPRLKEIVYGNDGIRLDTIPARPAGAVVKVDLAIPGCPIDKKEFLLCLGSLLLGDVPALPEYPVCIECKIRENACVLEDRRFCLGPVTRGGCNARCPSNNCGCEGCRGPVGNPNLHAQKDLLTRHGLTLEEMLSRFEMFQVWENQPGNVGAIKAEP